MANAQGDAHALHVQGVVAAEAGRLDEAESLIRRALRSDPGSADAHNSLGNVLAARGRHAEAAESYARAVELADGHVTARYHLALSLRDVGAPAEAEAHLRKILAADPDHVDARVELGSLRLEARDLPDALTQLADAIARDPRNARAFNDLGTTLTLAGAIDDAVQAFQRAVALRPANVQFRGNLSVALSAAGRRGEAGGVLLQRWSSLADGAPERRALLPYLIEVLRDADEVPMEPAWRAVALAVVTDDAFTPDLIAMPLSRGMRRLPGIAAALECVRAGRPALDDVAVQALFGDELVLEALATVLLRDPQVEIALTALRRELLHRGGAGAPAAFLCAMARQCFINEYAWFVADDEADLLAALVDRAEHALGDDDTAAEPTLAIVAMYRPLGSLRAAERTGRAWTAPFARVWSQQVTEPRRERELAERIPALTPIHDETSHDVRRMYEENPYPRWVRAPRPVPSSVAALLARLRPGEAPPEALARFAASAPVLVAGCGTGQHAAMVARELVGCDLLAVDLSRPSLGYAARMIDELGLARVQLGQADLLELRRLGRTFAVIECVGVLHHMADPLAGWRVLADVLHPHGVMKIGLYSTAGRQHLAAARALLAARGFAPTAAGIRDARRAILQLPEGAPERAVADSVDFYSSSLFRDLLMHVQEDTFSIPRLAQALGELGLRFLGFMTDRSTTARFQRMFAGRALTDLEAWDAFERGHPNTFGNMYQFWCCRRDATGP